MAGTANSGRKKLPAEDKILRGTFRPWRENKDMPQPQVSTKKQAPKHLSKQAKKIYTQVAENLIAQGVLKEGDEVFLEIFADAYSNWIDIVKELEVQGHVCVTSDTKETKINPLVRLKNKYADIIKQFGSEFGLSPAARSNIVVGKEEKEKSEFDVISDCKIHSFGA